MHEVAEDDRPSAFTEHRELLAAQRSGMPFLVHRDESGAQCVLLLDGVVPRLVVGRRETCDIVVDWDERVSRTHAELERVGGEWTIADDGLSRNGTYVNGQRVTSKRRLRDGDAIRVGNTVIEFRETTSIDDTTRASSYLAARPPLTESQQRVLQALARPVVTNGANYTPATNQEIASELFLSIDAVKGHLRQLFRRFEVDDLPQIQKRTALVRVAIDSGLVRRSPDASD